LQRCLADKAVSVSKLEYVDRPHAGGKDVPVNKFWSLTVYDMATWAFIYTPEGRAGHCQSKILNTWSGHRTAQIDPKNAGKSMAAKSGSDVLAK
jgi:hypothetical protein